MKRFDVVLLMAVIVTIAVVEVVRSNLLPPASGGKAGSSWRSEEKQVQEKIQVTQDSFDAKQLEKRLRQDPALRLRFEILGFAGLLVAMASLSCFMRWLARFFGHRPEGRLGSPPLPQWSFREVTRLVFVLVLVSHLFFLIELLLIHAFRPKQLDSHLFALGNTLLMDLAAFLGACTLFGRDGLLSRIQWNELGEKLRFGVVHYLAFLPLLVLVTIVAAMVMQFLKLKAMPQPVFTIFFSENRSSVIWWLFLLVTVAGPVAEELFFRGVLYGWLRTRIGVWKGLAVSALLFAALHGNPMVFLPIFGLGLLFGWVYEQTGSLAVPIGIHVLHNGGMLIVAFFLKSLS